MGHAQGMHRAFIGHAHKAYAGHDAQGKCRLRTSSVQGMWGHTACCKVIGSPFRHYVVLTIVRIPARAPLGSFKLVNCIIVFQGILVIWVFDGPWETWACAPQWLSLPLDLSLVPCILSLMLLSTGFGLG